ncbi:MAG: UvrD-helicase domain-containing protein [Candidatus Buchananbacteria bacterium]|nr:UvrD-helicase domain-containing protein [Candidatus Buchananbacteria bacterium]
MEINLKSLNDEQRQAVTHDAGPLLIVAGAGTGKTTVITQRIGWLIEQEKAKADEVLALTFTEKAATEMAERVDRLLPYGYVDLWILTFHAFAEKILQQHALEIGVPNDFKMLNQTEQWMLIRQNLDKFELDFYKPLGNPTKFIHALIKLFSRAKDEVISAQDYLEYAKNLQLNADGADFIKDFLSQDEIKTLSKQERKELVAQEIKKVQEVANAYHVYQQLLLENNALDFGDLINYCLKLFKTRPAVLAKYRQKFKYILVDEFQDTNYAQYELVKLLAEPNQNITVVGDDDQSIYKFRGASVSNILEFKKDYKNSKEVFLTKNYRSTQNILDLSYSFIQQNNPNRLEVKLAKNKKAPAALTKKLISQNKEKGEICHFHFETADDEVRAVLKHIADLKEKNPDASWGDFAILARTNEVANFFSQALSQTQIPYRFVASRGLYLKPVVLDILAYLRLLDDYHESSAVYRILNSPIVGLPDRTIVQLNYWARRKGYSLFATIQQPEVVRQADMDTRSKIQKFLGLVERHTQIARDRSVTEVVMAFLEDSGYLQHMTKDENAEMIQTTAYLNQFYKRINDFEQSAQDPSVKNFLELMNLELEAGQTGDLEQNMDEGPDAVKVMTIHAAKGLEFQYVWVVTMVDRRFPTDNRPDPISLPDSLVKEILPQGDVHLQEERRLFYVAMTRAKSGLYLTSASDYGGSRQKKISRFLAELATLGLPLDQPEEKTVKHKLKLAPSASEVTVRKIESDDISYLLPKKFSFTQLNSFENCPYHYWLEYILKIPQRGKNFFSFGSSIHATLQNFFLKVKERSDVGQQDLFGSKKGLTAVKKPLVSLEELLEIYERVWIDDWYGTRREHDEYKANGRRMLKDFYQQYEKELTVPKFLETPFNLHLKDEESGEHYTLIGKIDRVDQINNGVELIDYKTGASKKQDRLEPEDKNQLLIYQLAASQHLGETVEKLTYYYLEDGTKASFIGSQKDLDNLSRKMVKTIKAILEYPWPAKKSDCTCRFNNLNNL